MNDIVALRPFVPAKDFNKSIAFYEAIGFAVASKDFTVAILQIGGFSFILQNFYVEAFAQNCMIQLVVPDVSTWWESLDADTLVATFQVKPPIPPAMQHWGLKVGFIFDPSGVLWHVAEVPG